MRVAFTLIGGRHWTGGHNYLLNLLDVLVRYQPTRLTPVLFMGDDCGTDRESFQALQGLELVHAPHLDVRRREKSLFQAMLLGRDASLQRLFVQQRIDLVFESAQFFGWRLGIPAIAWIPDFQHRVLPRLFSRWAWWKREIGFRAQVVSGRSIMLSSEDARRACEHYYPATRGRTGTVHFAVPATSTADISAARRVADDYGLPDRYFFLPNQFWKHKNHLLVVEALAILRKRDVRIVVAASGKQCDPRDPSHFPRLQALVARLGVHDEMRFLGLLPYSHLAPLMRASVALLNPSLFEGWSTTVEEARALGTPMLLSDLDVHREQMGGAAVYFNRYSPESLADALQSFEVKEEDRRERLAVEARIDSEWRVRRFAEAFVEFAESCVRPTGR